MKTVKDIRRENLRFLVEQMGSMKKLNETLERKDNTLTQILNESIHSKTGAKKQMGDKLARDIETKLNLSMGWMDSEHEGIISGILEEEKEGILVRVLENSGSMGDDLNTDEDDVLIGTLTLAPEFVQKLRPSNPMNLSLITGRGDSMQPTIDSGDRVLVDEGIKELGDGIYVLRSYDKLFIKRVSISLKGKITISSDNPSVKLSEELDGSEELEIVGRVVYVWKGKFV